MRVLIMLRQVIDSAPEPETTLTVTRRWLEEIERRLTELEQLRTQEQR